MTTTMATDEAIATLTSNSNNKRPTTTNDITISVPNFESAKFKDVNVETPKSLECIRIKTICRAMNSEL